MCITLISFSRLFFCECACASFQFIFVFDVDQKLCVSYEFSINFHNQIINFQWQADGCAGKNEPRSGCCCRLSLFHIDDDGDGGRGICGSKRRREMKKGTRIIRWKFKCVCVSMGLKVYVYLFVDKITKNNDRLFPTKSIES